MKLASAVIIIRLRYVLNSNTAQKDLASVFLHRLDPKPKSGAISFIACLAMWRLRCRGVADGLEEAGERLLTFLREPPRQW